MAEPHPQNVPGPFYVENGCCLSCGVPEEIAPEMFDWAEGEPHCFVRSQPSSPEQLDKILHAMWSSEVECIRYRGTNPEVGRRIAEFGSGHCCDFPISGTSLVIRELVSFRSSVERDTPLAISDRFRSWLTSVEGYSDPRYRVKSPRWWDRGKVVFSWEANIFRFPAYNSVSFGRDEAGKPTARMRSGRAAGAQGLALIVHEWLNEIEQASQIRWFSREEREAGAPGFHMPI